MTMDLNDFIHEQDDLLDRLADIAERHNEMALAFDSDEVVVSPTLFNLWVNDHYAMLAALTQAKHALDACPLPPPSIDPSGQWFATIHNILGGLDDVLIHQLGTVRDVEESSQLEADEADDPDDPLPDSP